MIVRVLDEAHIVQIDIVGGGGRNGVTAGGGFLVCFFEGFGFVEEVCAVDGFEGNGLLEEVGEVGVGLCELRQLAARIPAPAIP